MPLYSTDKVSAGPTGKMPVLQFRAKPLHQFEDFLPHLK